MHGFVITEFERYVKACIHPASWSRLLADAGITPKPYLYVGNYPDQELMAIVTAVARAEKRSVPEILEEFGEFIAGPLLETYGSMAHPGWKTLDFIEHVEDTIHALIHLREPNADPPAIRSTRPATDEAVIHYDSPRKMCGFLKGLVKGIAKLHHEQVFFKETSCMLENQSQCIIVVKTRDD